MPNGLYMSSSGLVTTTFQEQGTYKIETAVQVHT